MGSRWFASFHFLSGAWQIQGLLFVVGVFFAFALLVGYRTCFATFICWALAVSLNVRNPYISAGGDVLLRAILFWLMFLPSGGTFSVDRAWASSDARIPKRVLSGATIAYAVQIVLLYWVSVLGKSGVEWRDGSAVYFALSIDYLSTPLGHWMLQLPPIMLKLATWGVRFYEAIGPMLLFFPWFIGSIRTFVVFGFIALHAGFLTTLLIGIFPLVGIVSILFFLPSWFWDNFLPTIATVLRKPIKIYYDKDCGFCWRTVQLLKTFVLSRESQIISVQSGPETELGRSRCNSWRVVDGNGREYSHFQGVVAIMRATPLTRCLMPLFGCVVILKCEERLYRFVGEHRSGSSTQPTTYIPRVDLNVHLSTCGNIAVTLFSLYVIAWNIFGLPQFPYKLSDRFRSIGELAGLDQNWDMFAPFPAKDNGWYVIPGRLQNGMEVDLFRSGGAPDWRKPKYISLEFKNHRWRKFMELVRKRPPLAASYAGYLCRDWNRSHSGGVSLKDLEIVYMLEWTRRDFAYFEPRKLSIFKFQCPPGTRQPAV